MLRFVPPAGTPVPVTDVFRAGIQTLFPNGAENPLDAFGRTVRSRHVFGLSSGRAALWLILKALHRLRPDRSVVAIPAYTCFSVAASAVRAGLKIYPIEMDSGSLDFDSSGLEQLPDRELLCVISANLFGFVNDMRRIQQIARERNAFIIDDAAQALGASRGGSLSGTMGDVGFFSLARGKALGGVEGGVVVTGSPEIAGAIRIEMERLPAPSSVHTSSAFCKLFATAVLISPALYWIPNSMPFLRLGTTEFEPQFDTSRLSSIAATLLRLSLDKLRGTNEIRRRNAAILSKALEENANFACPAPAPNCEATFIRFPVLAKNEATRDMALRRFRQSGIGASAFYPSAICDIAGIGSHMASKDYHRPKAENLARRLLTLPTHPLVTNQDLNRMCAILGAEKRE